MYNEPSGVLVSPLCVVSEVEADVSRRLFELGREVHRGVRDDTMSGLAAPQSEQRGEDVDQPRSQPPSSSQEGEGAPSFARAALSGGGKGESAEAHPGRAREAWGDRPVAEHVTSDEPDPPDVHSPEGSRKHPPEGGEDPFEGGEEDAEGVRPDDDAYGEQQYYEPVVKRLRWSDEHGYVLAEVRRRCSFAGVTTPARSVLCSARASTRVRSRSPRAPDVLPRSRRFGTARRCSTQTTCTRATRRGRARRAVQ